MGTCILYLLGDLPACTYVLLASKKIYVSIIINIIGCAAEIRLSCSISITNLCRFYYCTVWNSVFLLTYSTREDYRKRAFYTM